MSLPSKLRVSALLPRGKLVTSSILAEHSVKRIEEPPALKRMARRLM